MEYMIKALGVNRINTRFERMGTAAINAKPAMLTISEEMMRIFDATFNSQGRRGGGSWRYDTVEWLTRKVNAGLDPRIGHATLALRRSMSEPEAPHQILEITNTTVNLGTDLPYAQTEQRNRPFVKWTTADRARMRMIVRDYLVGAWKA